MEAMNRRVTLAARPVGMPKESDFRLEEAPMPHPAGGEVLVDAHHLSVDPYVRSLLSGVTTYARGLDVGEVIAGEVVGRVLESIAFEIECQDVSVREPQIVDRSEER